MLCKGKVVIVTGAASGIGRGGALAFAREGARVAVADVNRAGGEAVVRDIEALGGRAIFIDTDVTSEAAVAAMVERTVAEFGRLDAAFNNAGVGDFFTATSCTREQWDKCLAINVTAVWLCMKYEIPEMAKRGGGVIVNTASCVGERAIPNMFGYIAAKHAVIGMTRAAAVDHAAQNIRVNALLPGFTDTPSLRAALELAQTQNVDVPQVAIPLQRLGGSEEPGEAAVWMCSDHAVYMTGATLSVDGGLSARI